MRNRCRWIRSVAAIVAVLAYTYATAGPLPPPTVINFDVLFGTLSYNVIGSSRTDLPWEITGIQAVFSAPITSGDVNSLSGSGITPAGFSGLGTNTLTWTLSPPLSNGHYSAVLAGTGSDALSGAGGALNGGVDFTQAFSVLFGDFNDDGKVNSADVAGVLAATAQPYNVFADINGDGVVDSNDVKLVTSLIPTAPEPATLALLGIGLAGLGFSRRHKQYASA